MESKATMPGTASHTYSKLASSSGTLSTVPGPVVAIQPWTTGSSSGPDMRASPLTRPATGTDLSMSNVSMASFKSVLRT